MLLIVTILLLGNAHAFTDADWSTDAVIPSGTDRGNIYQLSDPDLAEYVRAGRTHALVYPVSVTGVKVPYLAFKNFLDSDQKNPLRKLLSELSQDIFNIQGMAGFYEWVGLREFPKTEGEGAYFVPRPAQGGDTHIGATVMQTKNGPALTLACTTCHASELFGKKVIGMTNKVTRANQVFHKGRSYFPRIPTSLFAAATGASSGDIKMFDQMRENFLYIDNQMPQALGLDTSLSVVALSLALRGNDPYALKSWESRHFPNPDLSRARKHHFDSKPLPWWNVKYKTRFLADGSIVSGNPIYTNFLWNEIGRSADLKELQTWLDDNQKTVQELTAAVFASQAPRYTDFFPASKIDLAAARRGEHLFINNCSECHGDYEKAWNKSDADLLTDAEKLETTRVIYHEKTPVINVGTDPARYQGMQYFAERLNQLAISKYMKTVVVPQTGYVPPPLVGIWARWPYFHNNSAPTLCDVLSASKNRAKNYYVGEAKNPDTDYDDECNGLPRGNKVPKEWKTAERFFDSRLEGLSNVGHDEKIFLKNGQELLSIQDKKDLIVFLKTL